MKLHLSSMVLVGFLILSSAISHAHEGDHKHETVEKPTVILETELGNITLLLEPRYAPKTVKNFLDYVNSGFYDGVLFHRVIPNFMAQTGGYLDNFVLKSTSKNVVNESVNGLSNSYGSIAMARRNNPDSANSQFFINVIDNHYLDAKGKQPGYTVFGSVIDGMKIVTQIVSLPQGKFAPQGFVNAPNEPVHILKARVLDKKQVAAKKDVAEKKQSIDDKLIKPATHDTKKNKAP